MNPLAPLFLPGLMLFAALSLAAVVMWWRVARGRGGRAWKVLATFMAADAARNGLAVWAAAGVPLAGLVPWFWCTMVAQAALVWWLVWEMNRKGA